MMNSQADIKWQPRPALIRVRIMFSLIAIDFICLFAAFNIAEFTRDIFYGPSSWFAVLATLVPFYFVSAINVRAFSVDTLQSPFVAIRRGIRALVFATAFTVFVAFSFKVSDNFPRIIMVFGFLTSALFLATARYLFVRHFEAIVGGNPFSVILISDGDQPVPAGSFSIRVAADAYFDPKTQDPVMYDRLARTLQSADRVLVACSPERRLAWAHALQGANAQGEILAPELASLAPLSLAWHGGMPAIVVATGPLKLQDRAIKRAFDMVMAGTLLLLLGPLLLLVALAIRFDSDGPILFRQIRIGRGNEMFEMLKFRSMQTAQTDGAGHRSAARDDQRVTRVGRLIRSTSIDELPQLVNVLKGNMSIVGPRPHALGSRAADKLFWEVDERYWHRHAAKPGLTGLAQIRGFRGATMIEEDLANRLQADLEYLKDWSIWRDFKIIFLTFRVILHRNAF